MKKYDALIFDLDGTLWDASATSTIAWNEGLKACGVLKTVTEDALRSVTGKPFHECLENLFPGIAEEYPQIMRIMDEFEEKLILEKGGKLYPGTVETLRELARDYSLFIISNCDDWYLDAFLSKYAPKEFFTGYDCHGMSGKHKASMIRDMVSKYRLSNPVYIGDTAHDQESARSAGIDFIHIAHGFGQAAGNVLSFHDFKGLREYLLG